MKSSRFVLLTLCGVSLAACERNTSGTPFEPDALAALRFVNAVPDTMQLDYRIVDIVTNAGMFNADFRSNQAQYVPILAGQHTIRVFLSDSALAVAQVVVNETTFDFEQGKSYTFIHSGYMRPGQTPAVTAAIVEDAPPTPAAGKVAVRALNLAAGLGGMDIFVGTTATGLPAASATWTNVAFGTYTGYVELDTAAYRVAATATGTVTPLVVANTAAPAGSAASGNTSAITGVKMAGSALTFVLLPRSVAGSRAPQSSAYTAPVVTFLNDRRP
jgi:hypothetical protein